MHTDLRQPHPATLTPLQTPSLHGRVPDHQHRLHLSLPTQVRAQDATHIGGRGPGLGDAFLLRLLLLVLPSPPWSFCAFVPSSSKRAPGLPGSCFRQLERRRPRPFPFSWLSLSPAAGTEGRIRSGPLGSFLRFMKTPLSQTRPRCSHMWTPHFPASAPSPPAPLCSLTNNQPQLSESTPSSPTFCL